MNARHHSTQCLAAGVVAGCFAFCLAAQPLLAATIDVGGPCSLADAITAANEDTATSGCSAGSGADEIRLFGNVQLTSSLPTISGGSDVTVRGNGFMIRRKPGAPDFRIFDVSGNGDLTLDNVKVVNGSGPIGAGVHSTGTLVIRNSTLSANNSFLSVGGGAIHSTGDLVVEDSVLTGNSAVHGAAIWTSGSTAVTRSHLTGNYADARGGAIHQYSGNLTVSHSTLSGNTVAGGAGAPGHNAGGGLFIYWAGATLTNSTISGNTIQEGNGGGIFNYYGALTLTNSTVAGNSATSGPEFADYISNSTFANTVFLGGCSFYYTPADGGGNFGCGFSGLTGFDVTLADNGGSTPTHALEAGSSAIDAGGSCSSGADQRDYGRSGDCDSGAYEFDGAPPAIGGEVAGVDTWRVECGNVRTSDRATIQLDGATSWDCEAAGVSFSRGDPVEMVLRGEGQMDVAIAGGVTGMSIGSVSCTNLEAPGEVTIVPAGLGRSWDCTTAGFAAENHQRVRVRIRGVGG